MCSSGWILDEENSDESFEGTGLSRWRFASGLLKAINQFQIGRGGGACKVYQHQGELTSWDMDASDPNKARVSITWQRTIMDYAGDNGHFYKPNGGHIGNSNRYFKQQCIDYSRNSRRQYLDDGRERTLYEDCTRSLAQWKWHSMRIV